jgi:hypothetical protein
MPLAQKTFTLDFDITATHREWKAVKFTNSYCYRPSAALICQVQKCINGPFKCLWILKYHTTSVLGVVKLSPDSVANYYLWWFILVCIILMFVDGIEVFV